MRDQLCPLGCARVLVTGASGARRKVTSHAADTQMRAPDGVSALVRNVAHLQCLTRLERAARGRPFPTIDPIFGAGTRHDMGHRAREAALLFARDRQIALHARVIREVAARP